MNAIETERLMIRQMDFNDLEDLMKIFQDPIAMQHYESTLTIEEAKDWIQWTVNNYKSHGVGLWICELKETGAFVGQCGIAPQYVEGNLHMEIGYLFLREYWGQGLATEAAIASRDFGFKHLNTNKLISLIYKTNIASIKVAEKTGMTFEKSTLIHNREYLIYSIENTFNTYLT